METTIEKHVIAQGTDAWFNIRLGKFTSSEVYNLFTEPRTKQARENGELSQSAQTYIEQKAVEMIYRTHDEFSSPSLDWGNYAEPLAINHYMETFGVDVKSGDFWTINDDIGSSPDGIVSDDKLIEIKCPYRPINHMKNCLNVHNADDLKKHHKNYYYQVMHQMFVTGAKCVDFVSFDPRLLEGLHWENAMHVVTIERDENVMAEMEIKLERAINERDQIINKFLKIEP